MHQSFSITDHQLPITAIKKTSPGNGGCFCNENVFLLVHSGSKFRTCFELCHFFSFDLDRFSCLRIASCASCTFGHSKCSETYKRNFISFFQCSADRIYSSVESTACISF